ncbi:MAG: diguanylate cyclase [Marinomonas sp.]
MSYFVDISEEMTLEDVQQQTFTPSTNSVSLGSKAKTTWAKIELQNTTKTIITAFLHHPYAYHNKSVVLYEVVDGRLANTRILDMDDPASLTWMLKGVAAYDVHLPPKQHTTLYIKSVSFSHQWFSLDLYGEEQSRRALLGQYTEIALLVGMLLALIIYNLSLFAFSAQKEHLFYALYLISGGFWSALSYGLLADLFEVYGSVTINWHISLGAMPVFLLLFMMEIFETKKKYPIEHKALAITATLITLNFMYGAVDIITSLKHSNMLAAIMMVVSLAVSVSMIIRRHPIAPFFLLGHSLFLIFSVKALLFYSGRADFTYINSHGVGIGILLEGLVLAFIIAYRIRTLEAIKASQEQLKIQATTDSMTQLFNRGYFNQQVRSLINDSKCLEMGSYIAIIDIDFFKNINDSYGHAFGDKAIIETARAIKENSRGSDVVARYGGEEFVIFMPETTQCQAFELAEKIRTSLKATLYTDDHKPLNLTVSIGLCEINDQESDLDICLNNADKALYIAKKQGKDQTKVYSEEM